MSEHRITGLEPQGRHAWFTACSCGWRCEAQEKRVSAVVAGTAHMRDVRTPAETEPAT